MLKIDYDHLKSSREGVWIIVDLIMLGLLIINLGLIIVDALFATKLINQFVQDHVGFLYPPLQFLNENFLLIDLWFVAIFLSEFCIRWWVSVKKETYARWYFFPFLHWYDLLGCIPLGSTRLLRFLRIFSILYRLQKYQIIDFRSTRTYEFITFYYNVFLEELSDRVVVKVLTGIQDDLRADSAIGQAVMDRIIRPRLPPLATSWEQLMNQLAITMKTDPDNYVSSQIRKSVAEAMQSHADIKRLSGLPFLGSQLADHLEAAVVQIVNETIANLLQRTKIPVDPEETRAAMLKLNERTGGALESFDRQIEELVIDLLEIAKEQVATQSWKVTLEQRVAQRTAPPG